MTRWPPTARFGRDAFLREARTLLELVRPKADVRSARRRLFNYVTQIQFDAAIDTASLDPERLIILRDCARAWRSILRRSSDHRGGFSVMGALWDLAHDVPRPDLLPGFYAELIHLVLGLEGRAPYMTPGDLELDGRLSGREAARARSRALDRMWHRVEAAMARYPDGLQEQVRRRRTAHRDRILAQLGATVEEWNDWKWQIRHVVKDPEALAKLVRLTPLELASIRSARASELPFGVTPYYLSLFDSDPTVGNDRAVRAQVLPPPDYVREMSLHHGERECAFDFMLEHDTSPIDLITRRYPAIAILKPFNTCPQICVYCQRNWEIDDAMAANALAPAEKLEAACKWLEDHAAIREVLVTGGDPLALGDGQFERLLTRLARIPHLDLIRIGSRTPVTVPMRITDRLATFLGSLRRPGHREVCLVTHVEHPYEITPELVTAVDRLRRAGVAVYNQQVFTFFVSRRFETARLRLLLRRAGIDPYYTFVPKGKDETRAYRVPLARMLQEQKEEARLLPGLRRTDEAVYNVPGLGKNHLRAYQHRDLISVLPDGTRVYEFHPWEKKVVPRQSYVGQDVPILDYLTRLAAIGEDPEDYRSIWYYF